MPEKTTRLPADLQESCQEVRYRNMAVNSYNDRKGDSYV